MLRSELGALSPSNQPCSGAVNRFVLRIDFTNQRPLCARCTSSRLAARLHPFAHTLGDSSTGLPPGWPCTRAGGAATGDGPAARSQHHARPRAATPDPQQCAGVVISGSHDMVTDSAPWMQELAQWLHRVLHGGRSRAGHLLWATSCWHSCLGTGQHAPLPVLKLGTVPIAIQADVSQDPLWQHMPQCFEAHVVALPKRAPSCHQALACWRAIHTNPTKPFAGAITSGGCSSTPNSARKPCSAISTTWCKDWPNTVPAACHHASCTAAQPRRGPTALPIHAAYPALGCATNGRALCGLIGLASARTTDAVRRAATHNVSRVTAFTF